MKQLHLRRCQPQESRGLREWIVERHYLRSAPPGYVLALEAVLGRERIGGLLFGRPCSRDLDTDLILSLDRLFFIDNTPPHVESQALAAARKHIRIWLPQIKLLVSYSDPAAGHDGTIYLADGWAPFGKTRNGSAGWANRPGRKTTGEKPTPKQRWVRSP